MTHDEIRAAIGASLGHHVHALIGFDGVIWDRETAEAIGLTDPEIWSPGMLARHYGVI